MVTLAPFKSRSNIGEDMHVGDWGYYGWKFLRTILLGVTFYKALILLTTFVIIASVCDFIYHPDGIISNVTVYE